MTSEETAQILAHGRQRVPSPLQCQTMARADVKEFLALFGNVGLDALGSPDARPLSRVFEGPFQEDGLMNPWQVGPIAEEQELITGPPILRRFGKWVPVTSPSLEMSMRLERSVWANHLWNPTISAGMAYLILKTPGLPQDNLGRETLPTSLIFLPATSMEDEEQQDVGKRRRISAGMVTEDVARRVSERLARGSVGSFVWNSEIRDQDVAFCIREEQRNSTMVLALLAIQTCLRVYEELKVDEARLLRLHFPSDSSPRQPALILGVLFGEAVLRNLPRAYQICLAEANRRIAAFRRRNLASSSGSSSMPPPAASSSMPPPAASASVHPPVFPPLPPPLLSSQVLTRLAVAQAKHPSVPPVSGVSGLEMGLRPPVLRSPAPLTPPGSACNWRWRYGSGAQDACVEAFIPSSLAASSEGPVPTTPPHILAGGSGDNAAPTTPVEIVERLQDSFPPMLWNRPDYEGKGADAIWYYGGMRTTTDEGPVILRRPEIPPLPMLGVNLPQPGVRWCFRCGCARYGILGIKWQCTPDGPTKWDALYLYTRCLLNE